MLNPYLSIDKKYFISEDDGQFIITLDDLLKIPKLKQYVNISYLKDNQILINDFPINIKNEIGLLFFEYYGFIIWVKDKKYLNLKELYPNHEELNLQKTYYLNSDENILYETDKIDKTSLFKIVTKYFYSRYYNTTENIKFIENTEILTDINLNKNHYDKVPDDINFIVDIFKNWLNTRPNTIPFSPNYGNSLKDLIQEKNNIVKLNYVRTEIVTFFEELSSIYNSLVKLLDVKINLLTNYGIEINISLLIKNENIAFDLLVREQ